MSDLPSIEELQRRQVVADPVFDAWRNSVPDKHWAAKDLSALRIGFELGKCIARETPAQPEGGEAVAWRVRIADGTSFLTVNRDIVDKWEGATWEPLYTRPAPAQQAVTVDDALVTEIAKKLRKLRLTDVGGRKENPAATVKSCLQAGLGGLYDDAAADYIVRAVLRYHARAALISTAAKAAEGAK